MIAHHGSNGQFDHSIYVRVSGVVTDVRFVNPHSYVYLDVTNKDGGAEPWRCEMRAGSLLNRNGWTTEMFSKGTRISIEGSAARREQFGCYLRSVKFESGLVAYRKDDFTDGSHQRFADFQAELADGTPNLNGNWVASYRSRNFLSGIPLGPLGRSFKVTEEGAVASAGFKPEENPRYNCTATNIFHDLLLDQHVNSIVQSSDKIVLRYGFMDIVRTINLGIESHPGNLSRSRAGHSIGFWEKDTLVVDTVGFEPGYLEATVSGIRHSDQMRVSERFSMSDDGRTLDVRYLIEDPSYLASPVSGELSLTRTSAPFEPYQCEDLTEELVEGF